MINRTEIDRLIASQGKFNQAELSMCEARRQFRLESANLRDRILKGESTGNINADLAIRNHSSTTDLFVSLYIDLEKRMVGKSGDFIALITVWQDEQYKETKRMHLGMLVGESLVLTEEGFFIPNVLATAEGTCYKGNENVHTVQGAGVGSVMNSILSADPVQSIQVKSADLLVGHQEIERWIADNCHDCALLYFQLGRMFNKIIPSFPILIEKLAKRQKLIRNNIEQALQNLGGCDVRKLLLEAKWFLLEDKLVSELERRYREKE
jgi:hypothetical protein